MSFDRPSVLLACYWLCVRANQLLQERDRWCSYGSVSPYRMLDRNWRSALFLCVITRSVIARDASGFQVTAGLN